MEVLVSWSRPAMVAAKAPARERIRRRFGIASITVNLTSRFTVTQADLADLHAVARLGYFRVLSLSGV